MTKPEILPIKLGRGVAFATFLLTALVLPSASSAVAAPPPLISQFCGGGSGPRQCGGPVATDPESGNVYVADSNNNRISEFTIWGQFVKAFGGGVVNGGATGTGILNAGSATVSSVSTTARAFVPGMAIEATGIAPGTTVTEVSGLGTDSTLTLSQPATANASPAALRSPEAPGNVPTNELQRISVTATNGAFKLRFITPAPDNIGQTTTSLPYNASAAQVQSALEGLPNIGAGNVAVSSVNPGGQAGVPGGPYTVEFKGARFSDTNVRSLRIEPGAPVFSGGNVDLSQARQGASAPEVCTGVDCREGVEGIRAGQFARPTAVAVASGGELYVYEIPVCTGGTECGREGYESITNGTSRVQKFDSEGNFLLMFGGDVNEGGGTPSSPGDVCTAQHMANGDMCGPGKFGSGDGEFGTGSITTLDAGGSVIAAGPSGTIYVGGQERIQEFSADGTFLKSIPFPGEYVSSLAVDPVSGDLYIAFTIVEPTSTQLKKNVLKMSPAGVTLGTLPVKAPRAVATDAARNVYVVDGFKQDSDQVPIDERELRIRKFNAEGTEVPSFTFSDGIEGSGSIATSSACGVEGADLLVSAQGLSGPYIRAYGPLPDPAICPPPTVPPTIVSQYAVSADTDGATLKARINPNFWPDTTYYVQYGTGKCSEGGCDKEQPVAPGSRLTTATTGRTVDTTGVFLGGLEASTTYHYRFVSQSSGGGPVRGVGGEVGNDGGEGIFTTLARPPAGNEECPNQAFRTSVSATLPDCRAYEMVSPLDKNNGDIQTVESLLGTPLGGRKEGRLDQATPAGDKITYSAQRAFADAQSGGWASQYIADRDPETGWETRPISPPRRGYSLYFDLGQEIQFKGFSEDLCSAWVLEDSGLALAPGSPAGVPNLYRRKNCGEEGYELLTSEAPPGFSAASEPANSAYVPYPQGFSVDGSSTVFRANAKLTPKACDTKAIYQVYESTGEGGLRLVSVLPNGNAVCTHTAVGSDYGNLSDYGESNVRHAVSNGANRVYWTDSEAALGRGRFLGPGKLYLRENADQPQSAIVSGKCSQPTRACTVAVSGPNSEFWTADPAGATAIYRTGEKLYEFDAQTASSQLIAEGVHGHLGASEDASRLYLVSTKPLAGEAVNSEGDKALAGQPNVFLYTKGAGFTFVATLASVDSPTDLGAQSTFITADNIRPSYRVARVSPDGLHVVFMSRENPTGYDNTDLNSGEAATEVYLYDASANSGSGQLVCVSCNPSGARPLARKTADFGTLGSIWAAAQIPGWETDLQPSRVLSDDGSRLFFESFEALVLADTNGQLDVYEWEAAGSGDCVEGKGAFSQSAGGCVSLISSGESPQRSEFLDASSDGRDVFFTTNASLLPQDTGLIDIYDARAGGGYPAPAAPPVSCEGEACQGPLAPPNDPTPASSAFEGAGNVVEKPAKKTRAHKKKAHKKKKVHKKQRQHNRASHERRVIR